MNRRGRVAAVAAAAVLASLGAAACGPAMDPRSAETTFPIHGEGAPGIDESIETVVASTAAPKTATPTTPTLTTPTLTTPIGTSEPTVVGPTGLHPLWTGPTVTIELPYNGWQPAPTGSVKIPFHGWATDATGATLPGTRLRWTAIEGNKSTVLCSGSDFGPPPPPGGIVVVTDCTQFHRTFTNPRGGSGPSITIRLEAEDQVGLYGSAEVVIALYTPPGK